MIRRSLSLAVALGAVLGCGQDPAGEAVDGEAQRPPNVVFILADDLGYGDLGLYGSEIIETPHIDSLAAAGVRFTAGYVTAAVCSPSRAGLMTGRYPQRHGYEFNPSGQDYGLSLDETTLAEVMRAAGYATGAVGKWQLGWGDGQTPARPRLRRVLRHAERLDLHRTLRRGGGELESAAAARGARSSDLSRPGSR